MDDALERFAFREVEWVVRSGSPGQGLGRRPSRLSRWIGRVRRAKASNPFFYGRARIGVVEVGVKSLWCTFRQRLPVQ